ncbi:MAG TPA: hypothetical protein VFZ25_06000 [Chloroflexota bacterium]|nr:hypothetical protein [Chloroflexota bacterium]
MYRVIGLLGIAILAGIVTACGPPGGPAASAPPAFTPSPITANVAPATPSITTQTPGVGTSVAGTLTPQISVTAAPSVAQSPTITPTLGPPTATATPAPDATTLQSAEDLDQAVVTFAQAAAAGDTQSTLQAQRKLLDASQAAAKIAAADQSPYGQKLRSALGALQGGVAGDYDKLNEAHQDLQQIAGDNGTPVVGAAGATASSLPRPAAQSQQSLNDVASSLQRAVDAYNKALNSGNASDLLRAQADLLNAVATADAATKNARTPLGQQIQTALGQIHDGLGGDTGKFADAETTLAGITASGSNSQTGTPTTTVSATPTQAPTVSPTGTPTGTPTITPTGTPTGTPTVTPTGTPTGGTSQNANLQPLQNNLDNKLQTLQVETTDQNKDNLARAQGDVNQAIQDANDAIANDHSPAADRFRAALGTAKTAAGGDFSKIQSARDQLKAALSQT